MMHWDNIHLKVMELFSLSSDTILSNDSIIQIFLNDVSNKKKNAIYSSRKIHSICDERQRLKQLGIIYMLDYQVELKNYEPWDSE